MGDQNRRCSVLLRQWEHAGCGLPPGPSGLIGTAEGFSYVTLLGIAGWGIGMRATTSRGLPSGSLQLPSCASQHAQSPGACHCLYCSAPAIMAMILIPSCCADEAAYHARWTGSRHQSSPYPAGVCEHLLWRFGL